MIEAEIYGHFARDTAEVDTAILIAKHFKWKLVRRHEGWESYLEKRIKEMESTA